MGIVNNRREHTHQHQNEHYLHTTLSNEEFNNNLIQQALNNNNLDSFGFPRQELEHNHNSHNSHNNQIIVEHQKTKQTKSYKNPIMLIKSSLKLEKDSTKGNIYYITFSYISLQNFSASFLFNA